MSTVTKFISNHFGGIRRKNSSFSEELISCSDCQNVELFFTDLNSGVGVRTTSGNTKVADDLIPSGQEIIGIFETMQNGSRYIVVYAIDDDYGYLYNVNIEEGTKTTILDDLSPEPVACATDYAQGYKDMFIFSNGANIVYLYTDTSALNPTVLEVEDSANIHLIDDEDTSIARDVMGLGMKVYDSRLWIFNKRVLWYSKKGDCREFRPIESDADNRAGYIEFVKDITAIYPYLGSLAVFHRDSSCLVEPDSTTMFLQSDESPGGCASYSSLIFHGVDLYFYDDTKRGVFSFKQIVNGDKTLSDNIAIDLQNEFANIDRSNIEGTTRTNIDRIKAVSVITKDRNEVWLILPTNDTYAVDDTTKAASIVLIYDYLRGEWVKRKCQHINTVLETGGLILSGGNDLYFEYNGNTFDGDFIESYYTCSEFNLGEDNSMKITKTPPRITVGGNTNLSFWVDYIKNYNEYKAPKSKPIRPKRTGETIRYNTGRQYNTGCRYAIENANTIVKIPSVTFKTLKIKFRTDKDYRAFSIKVFEISKLKIKQV